LQQASSLTPGAGPLTRADSCGPAGVVTLPENRANLMQRPRARLLWPSLFTFLTGAALISLGVWQLQRLEWKEKLIADPACDGTLAGASP
jgi:SURF1 family